MSAPVGRRLAVLVGAIAVGVAVGLVVERLAGSAWGFVAVPLSVVVGWWRVADPTRCTLPASGDTPRATRRP